MRHVNFKMASKKYREEERFLKTLRKESKKLHTDVENMQDALLLHQRFQKADEESVRGILRKEIGGSIWEHGGAGKMNSYRGARDLKQSDVKKIDKKQGREVKLYKKSKENEGSNKQSEKTGGTYTIPVSQIQDVKVVNKAETKERQNKNVDVKIQSEKRQNESKLNVLEKDQSVIDGSTFSVDKMAVMRAKVLEKASASVIKRKKLKSSDKNLESHENVENKINQVKKEEVKLDILAGNVGLDNQIKRREELLSHAGNAKPHRDMAQDENIPKTKKQQPKQTNRIDPELTKEVDSEYTHGAKDFDISSPLKNGSNSLDKKSAKLSSPPRSSHQDKNKYCSKTSVFNEAKNKQTSKCDPNVHLWLRRLGLLEEEKYVKVFTDNEIDMDILLGLDEPQLEKMGVHALGAMKKLLAGIQELKNRGAECKATPTAKISSQKTNTKEMSTANKKGEIKVDDKKDTNAHITANKASAERYENAEKLCSDSRTEKLSGKSISAEDGSIQSKTYAKNDDIQDKVKNTTKTRNRHDRTESSGARKRDSSLTRPCSVRGVLIASKRPQSAKNRDKASKPSAGAPRGKSADVANKKAIEGIRTAAKRKVEKNKQEKLEETKLQKEKEQKKSYRNEMAARHQEREKKRREEIEDLQREIDKTMSRQEQDDLDELVKVITTCNTDKTPTSNNAVEITTKPPTVSRSKRPLYRPNPSKPPLRQSLALPANSVQFAMEENGMALSSHRSTMTNRHSYSSRSNTVKDIEKQIETLRKRALSGEMVTMDLVKDLQKRLEEIETTIKNPLVELSPIQETGQMSELHLGVDPFTGPTYYGISDEIDFQKEMSRTNPIAASMSKRELFDEMKREKKLHRNEIRHLSSELHRIRQADPIRTVEIGIQDLDFDESDLIGEGSFSKVYHGLYQGSDVAIKQLKIPLSSHDHNYFTAEVSLLKDLRHPRVVLLMGVCTTEKLPLMVLEYMANGTLSQLLHDQNRPSLDHAEYYRYAHDIALGMNYLHQHKPTVLHLDLKSMNVLLCSNNRAKIADFGFSKFRHDADMKATKSSKVKPVQGSPVWMAPELLETGDITAKADVYSFAIIMWEMLTRKQPYENCSVFQVLERVRINKRPEIPDSCPEQLASFIKQCWDPLPSRRPPFKDIVVKLENMTFPPEWQALFKEAGIPPVALEDVQSTRTIISLVSNTLDIENVKTMVEDIRVSQSLDQTVNQSQARNNHMMSLNLNDSGEQDSLQQKKYETGSQSLSETNSHSDRTARQNKSMTDLSLNLNVLESPKCQNAEILKMSSSSEEEVEIEQKVKQKQASEKETSLSLRLSLDAETLNSQRRRLRNSVDLTSNASSSRIDSNNSAEKKEMKEKTEEQSGPKQSSGPVPTPRTKRNSPGKPQTAETTLSLQEELNLKLNKSSAVKLNLGELSNRSTNENNPSAENKINNSKIPEGHLHLTKDQPNLIDSTEQYSVEDKKKIVEGRPVDKMSHDLSQEVRDVSDIDEDSLEETQLRDSLEDNSLQVNTESHSFQVVKDASFGNQSKASSKSTKSNNGSILEELNSKFYDAKNVKVIGKPTSDESQNLFSTRQSIEAWVDDKERIDSARSDRKRTPPSQLVPPPIIIPNNPPPAPPPPPPLPSDFPCGIPMSSQHTGFLVVSPVKKQTPKSDTELRKNFKTENNAFMIQSVELREQRDLLQPTDEPHPYQLKDLSHVSKGTMSSIAEILRQAVSSRRVALREDNYSPPPSVRSSWSCLDD